MDHYFLLDTKPLYFSERSTCNALINEADKNAHERDLVQQNTLVKTVCCEVVYSGLIGM